MYVEDTKEVIRIHKSKKDTAQWPKEKGQTTIYKTLHVMYIAEILDWVAGTLLKIKYHLKFNLHLKLLAMYMKLTQT